jgi:hypothetical protein
MPPQQGNRLLDFVDGAGDFGAHGVPNQRVGVRDIGVWERECNSVAALRPSTSTPASTVKRKCLIFDFGIAD